MTDFAATIQQTINAARQADGSGATVLLPPGEVYTTSPMSIRDVSGLTLTSGGGTVLRATNGTPCILDLRSAPNTTVSNLWVKGQLGGVVNECAILLSNGEPGQLTRAQSRCYFRDLQFGSGNSAPDFLRCIVVDSKYFGGPDQNNDLHIFERVRCNGYRYAAAQVVAGSSQTQALTFRDFDMVGDLMADWGLYWDSNADFKFDGGSGGRHKRADFWIGNLGSGVAIANWKSEWTNRLMETAGPTGAISPFTIGPCIRVDAMTATDGRIIIGKHPGPWTITGNYFHTELPTQLWFDFYDVNVPVSVVITGNYFAHGKKTNQALVKAKQFAKLVMTGNRHSAPGVKDWYD